MKKILLYIIFTITFCSVKAQISSIPFSQSIDTFQFINGTIVDTYMEDDIFHPNLPIGFNFNFNGVSTNKFGICTNGYITLDSNSTSSLWIINANSKKVIAPMLADLRNSNAGGSIEYVTIGTAPNRVLIVQWKDYSIFGIPFCHLNFQIRLHENNNSIQFYYGTNALSGNTSHYFNVGLLGDSLADFNFRTTPSDWINTNASPQLAMNPNAGNSNNLNALSILPSGLVYCFSYYCPSAGTPFSYLTGKVYNDNNNNGIKDIGENGMPNVLVHESLQNYNTFTDSAGDYHMFFIDSMLTYNLSTTAPLYWTISSLPTTHSVNPNTQSTTNKDFGMYATPNIHDISIVSNAIISPWPNGTFTIFGTYHNQGTVIEPGDVITLNLDTNLTYISANPAPTSVSGNTLTWNYANLLINEYRTISLQVQADSTLLAGDSLHSNWTILPTSGDALVANNTYDLNQIVVASFDPNEKAVSPNGNIVNNQELEYIIRFQNTGNFPALNVFINDTLDQNLDVNTFQLLSSSHPVVQTLNGYGNLRFTFANINLPDSVNNEPASHGYIMYKIKPIQGLSVGTKLHNTAAIIFDFNDPVITNTTENIIFISEPDAIKNISADYTGIILYPNPINNQLNISSKTSFEKATITVSDLLGRTIIKAENQSGKLIQMDWTAIKEGYYIVEIKEKSTSSKVKVLKR
jgi:uncharacterized repeat protein (TIGR01451 family)